MYQAEKLSFPTDLHAWASSYAQIWARASNLKYWQEIAKTGAWAGVAVAVRLYCLFLAGETEQIERERGRGPRGGGVLAQGRANETVSVLGAGYRR